MMEKLRWALPLLLILGGCSFTSDFMVKSDPLQADIFVQNPKTGEKKPLGKTPLEIPSSDIRNLIGNDIGPGEYFNVIIEKQGYVSQSVTIPATRFGTMATQLDVKLKEGTDVKEQRLAADILNHLFVAQKLALQQQFERAQIELDKIIGPFPTFARALSMRASIYYAQKNYADSLKWYEEALKADPQMDDAIKMIAKVRTLQGIREPASATTAPPPASPTAAPTAPDKGTAP
jgi:tetratricopeptide (TPR) repeat protein